MTHVHQRSPMAHAVIGGLIASTLLTLIVVPVICIYTEQLGAWALKRLRNNAHHVAPVVLPADLQGAKA